MSIIVEKSIAVPMRDGVVLRADVYRPQAPGPHPVLLQRTPYNRELWPITAMTLDPVRAAAAGYAVVIQDVRGRWASEGDTFFPYRDELNDGHDSVAWAAAQGWSSGAVGCYGLSYMGGTSWLAAASGHPALKALSPTTAPCDFWHNHFWRGGALNIGLLAMWSMRAIGPTALIRGRPDPAEFFPLLRQLVDDMDDFETVLRQLPLEQFAPTRPGDERFVPFFFEMLRHAEPDAWTKNLLVSGRHAPRSPHRVCRLRAGTIYCSRATSSTSNPCASTRVAMLPARKAGSSSAPGRTRCSITWWARWILASAPTGSSST